MIYEIFLQAYDYPEPHRAKAGDILAIREYTGQWGAKAAKQTICITVDISDRTILADMDKPDPTRPGEKRWASVPLTRLKSIMSSMDLARVADKRDDYQPFMIVDTSRRLQTTRGHVPITNLFMDKRII